MQEKNLKQMFQIQDMETMGKIIADSAKKGMSQAALLTLYPKKLIFSHKRGRPGDEAS